MLAYGSDLQAVAFRLPNQDAEGIARGNAMAATADNPSAIYYNPAGITQIKGQQFRAGLYMISAHTEYVSSTGAEAQTDNKAQFVPQIYYVRSFEDKPLTFGLGIYAPYGLSLDYGNGTSFNTLAEYGKLLYASINPVIAWRINPTLSIAAGPTINYSQAELRNALLGFNGDAWGLGFNAGLLWQPYEEWSFGVNYRYATSMDYSGHSSFLGGADTRTSAEIVFPQYVVIGVSYRPTEKWNLEFDLDWTDWDNVNTTEFHGTSIGTIPFAFNYRSSFMYEFGVTRKLNNGWFISAGYFYSENSSPDVNYNPIVPDANLHLGSFGFGRKGESWDWMIAYHFGLNPGRTVTGSTSATGQTADGTYRTLNQAINISFTYKF